MMVSISAEVIQMEELGFWLISNSLFLTSCIVTVWGKFKFSNYKKLTIFEQWWCLSALDQWFVSVFICVFWILFKGIFFIIVIRSLKSGNIKCQDYVLILWVLLGLEHSTSGEAVVATWFHFLTRTAPRTLQIFSVRVMHNFCVDSFNS